MLKLAGEIIISVLRICFVLHLLSDEVLKQRNRCSKISEWICPQHEPNPMLL